MLIYTIIFTELSIYNIRIYLYIYRYISTNIMYYIYNYIILCMSLCENREKKIASVKIAKKTAKIKIAKYFNSENTNSEK